MRSPRLTPPDIPFHVLNRAAGRRQIFIDDNDYAQFEVVLDAATRRFGVELASYCVMPNHFHLLLTAREDGELSRYLAWLQSTHAKRWHASRVGTGGGALYQGRFRSFPIQDDRHLETVWRYIERNPVRAGLVARAEEWPWGSAWNRAHAPERAARLLRNAFLAIPEDWLERVNEPVAAVDQEALQCSLRRGQPFGNPVWQTTMAERLGLARACLTRGRPRSRPEKGSDSISVAEIESDPFSVTGRGLRRGRNR